MLKAHYLDLTSEHSPAWQLHQHLKESFWTHLKCWFWFRRTNSQFQIFATSELAVFRLLFRMQPEHNHNTTRSLAAKTAASCLLQPEWTQSEKECKQSQKNTAGQRERTQPADFCSQHQHSQRCGCALIVFWLHSEKQPKHCQVTGFKKSLLQMWTLHLEIFENWATPGCRMLNCNNFFETGCWSV